MFVVFMFVMYVGRTPEEPLGLIHYINFWLHYYPIIFYFRDNNGRGKQATTTNKCIPNYMLDTVKT